MLPTPQEMKTKFITVFTTEQTTVLVEVLDAIRRAELQHLQNSEELKEGLARLSQDVRDLAAAQKQTDQRVAELAAAQKQTDARVAELAAQTDRRFAELAAAQKQTDQRVAELAAQTNQRFAELAAAQKQTDARVAELAAAQKQTDDRLTRLIEVVEQNVMETQKLKKSIGNLQQAVGSLANTFGFNLEEFVAALLPPYLEKHAGITGLTLDRDFFQITPDNPPEEVDLVGYGERNNQPVLVLAECRTTIGGGEMRRIASKLEAIIATNPAEEVVKIVVAMNLHPTGKEAAQETGIWAIPYSKINRERWAY